MLFRSEDLSDELCLKESMGLTILRFYGLSVLVLQLSDAEFILCTFITMLFLLLRYVNELCKQLKKKFPLASQTAEDNSAERDNVVHIYYKVLFNNPLFVFLFCLGSKIKSSQINLFKLSKVGSGCPIS